MEHHGTTKDTGEWIQTRLVPAECFRMEVVVHSEPKRDVHCLSLEVTDPHTRELLARHVTPFRPNPAGTTLAADISIVLRRILLELTDPEPF